MKIGKLIIGLILIFLAISSKWFPVNFSLIGFQFVSLSLFVLGAILIVLGFRKVTNISRTIQDGLGNYSSTTATGERAGLIFFGLILIIIGLGILYFPLDFSLFNFSAYEGLLLILGLFWVWKSFRNKRPRDFGYLNRTGKPLRI